MHMSRRWKRILWCVLPTILIVVILMNLFYMKCLRSSIASYQVVQEYLLDELDLEFKEVKSDTKYVLFWTTHFGNQNWGLSEGDLGLEYLRNCNCPKKNCMFTSNRKLLESTDQYDAILFNGAEQWNLMELPKTRSPHQFYVVNLSESPALVKHMLEFDHDFYNWTMTYRLDSDILWSYGSILDLETESVLAPAKNIRWKVADVAYFDEQVYEIVKQKTKSAAWFVSHCHTISKRDDLVREMQKLMQVDIFGKCGTLSCPRGSIECSQMLNSTYKFYLAFENAICDDYVTEKLFDIISNNYIVPIVYGGADYLRLVPPNSYINANDFEDVADLVSHLNYLDKNPLEYMKYFWWKKHYKVINSHPFCELCEKLNEPNVIEKRQTYRSIKQWWFNGVCRKKGKIKF